MLKKAFNIWLIVFYTIGTFCLPMGNFAALQDIPQMYRFCKATEDKDMGPLDFITDHLINIDGIFDEHTNGDDQKPHEPQQTQHHGQQSVLFATQFTFLMKQVVFIQINPAMPFDNFHVSDFVSKIFRPPIAKWLFMPI